MLIKISKHYQSDQWKLHVNFYFHVSIHAFPIINHVQCVLEAMNLGLLVDLNTFYFLAGRINLFHGDCSSISGIQRVIPFVWYIPLWIGYYPDISSKTLQPFFFATERLQYLLHLFHQCQAKAATCSLWNGSRISKFRNEWLTPFWLEFTYCLANY